MANTTTLEWLLLAKDQASDVFEKVGKSAEKSSGHFDKLKAAGALGLAAAGVAVADFGADSVRAYTEAEESQNRLRDAFDKFPSLADTNIEKMQGLNSQLAKKTKFDDDATASGQAVLAQFGLTGQQLTDITPLLQDYAAKTGKDLPSAAEDLGKAMLGQGKALKGIGLNFKDTGSSAGNFEELMGGLRTQVGGFATKEGATASGQAAILSNQFGELQETVGSKLVPILQKVTEVGIKVVTWLTDTPGALMAVAIALGIMALAWAAVTLAASPWLLIGLGIAAVIAGIVLVIQNWGTIGPWIVGIWNTVMDAIRGFVETCINWIKENWPLLLAILTGPIGLAVLFIVDHWGQIKDGASDVVESIRNFFSQLPGKIGTALGGIAETVTSPFRSAFGAIARLWNSTIGKIGFTVPDWVPLVGGKTFNVPNVPGYANGTMFHPGGLAMVGERGPEVVSLPRGSQVFPNGSGPGGRMHPDDLGELVSAMYAVVDAVADGRRTAKTAAVRRGLRATATGA